ncbi:MAG: GatB/YqeY domain-containing protein [Gammaproteobacteria bacterium]
MAAPVPYLQKEIQSAMKAGERLRVDVLRMLLAAVRSREIDSGTPADEAGLVAVVQKLIKQRQESAAQYEQAGRDELATREREEITVLTPFLPPPVDEAAINAAIDTAIADCGAESMRDMGKVIAKLKTALVGVDMGEVSKLVKQKLGGG